MKGVTITKLTKIPDERGSIYHMLRSDSPTFKQFGEIYFSKVYPGVIKGWHLHKKMTLNYAVIEGTIKLVVANGKEVEEIYIGEDNYCLVTIEPGIWNGFKGVGTKPAIVANCSDIPHDPDEIVRMSPFDYQIDYDWSLQHK